MMIIIHLQHHTDGSSGISVTIFIGSDFMSQLTIVDRINVLSVASQIQSVALPASLREVLQLIALRFFLVPVFIRLSNGCQVGPVCRIGIEAAARIVHGHPATVPWNHPVHNYWWILLLYKNHLPDLRPQLFPHSTEVFLSPVEQSPHRSVRSRTVPCNSSSYC